MTRKNPRTQADKAPRRPLRSIPWWMLLSLVVVCITGVWIGTRWGDRLGAAVREVSARVRGEDAHDATAEGDAAAVQYYTCGMHPQVILPEPGECPICHMDLIPLDPAKFTGEVLIDPVVVQNIGVRIGAVAEGPLVRTIRTVGTVDYDETRVRDVNTKFGGWIEKLFVDYEGAPVTAGDPLFEIYSPALLSAQEEFLLALRARGNDPTRPGQLDMVDSARTKLALFDVTPAQIDALVESGKATRTLTLLSPHTGTVIAKHANEGMKVDPGMQVFRIADLSKVWVLVTLYESQLPFVSLGQSAAMSLPYIPGQSFEGKVVYIYPYLDTKTREVRVRLEFDNAGGLLKPGMFTTIELRSTLRRKATLAPREAVISTGERDVAFVSLGEGRFEPREVRLGVETGAGEVEILEGLAPGEMVVTSGQFLLDSESRVREALAKMVRGDMAADQTVQAASAGAAEVRALPAEIVSGLGAALDAYFAVGDRLASDTPAGIDEPARALAAALDGVIGTPVPGDEHFWSRHTEAATARGSALELLGVTDLAAAREHFADLSVAMDTLVRATGVPAGYGAPVQSLHCPMFREGQGGSTWLQPEGAVRNPFFGSMMLRCFDKRETIPVTGASGGALDAPAEAPAGPQPAGPADPTPETQRSIDGAVGFYLQAQHDLTLDESADAGVALGRLRATVLPLVEAGGEVGAQARALTQALADPSAELTTQRAAFGVASEAMLALLAVAPPSTTDEAGLFRAHCPMVNRDWLQVGDEIRNPYDSGMLSCGRIEARIEPRVAGSGGPGAER